jgi:hypothetical protein
MAVTTSKVFQLYKLNLGIKRIVSFGRCILVDHPKQMLIHEFVTIPEFEPVFIQMSMLSEKMNKELRILEV